MRSEADRLIEMLGLKPHPEGGHFRETFRDCGPPTPDLDGNRRRAHSTAIYFLIKAGEVSRWHRIDAPEVWHFYRGAPLELRIGKETYVLGSDIDEAQVPQDRGAGRRLAGGQKPWQLQPGRLHGCARFRVRKFRNGAGRFCAVRAGSLNYCELLQRTPRRTVAHFRLTPRLGPAHGRGQ
jgi:Cupin superfamily (DUF985)